MKLLVLEDDAILREEISGRLRRAGFAVDTAGTLADARFLLDIGSYGCVIFDRTVLDGDAIDLVADLRRADWATPVLFLTAHGEISQRVAGFHSGGDDYLVKPFAFPELEARIRALTSRRAQPMTTELVAGDVHLDPLRHQVTRGGVLLSMTPKEFAVLQVLLDVPNAVVTRTQLIEQCWDDDHDPMSNVVDVLIWQLRRTLGAPDPIETIRGAGYRFRPIAG